MFSFDKILHYPIPREQARKRAAFPSTIQKNRHNHPPPTPPRIPHPVNTFTPTTTPNSCVAGGQGCGEGKRPSLTPSASPPREFPPSKRQNLYQKNHKNKIIYKKETIERQNVQQSLKKEIFYYLFLTFSNISSALSTSVFSSFGRTMFKIIANTAAGTIPEPPKIRLMACGRCTRIAVLEPSP